MLLNKPYSGRDKLITFMISSMEMISLLRLVKVYLIARDSMFILQNY